jgi:PPOX class probable F420-dependent enzyme
MLAWSMPYAVRPAGDGRRTPVLDPTTPQGARAAQRLHDELIVWLTTVTAAGQPQTSPVWFLWDGETFLIYSTPRAAKMRNLVTNPRVGLHLDGNGRGGDVVSIEGTVVFDAAVGAADGVPAYVGKYSESIATNGWTPASFAKDFSEAIRVTPGRVRAW